ncbi:MAG: hypothetical protein ABS96_23725 [Lysobacteraceae bacterium SCN 69-123]|nr:MAG: hypothetical protein ABS96_23725 [Xanthomonadaceae bacterium SCN 69-123]
METMLKVERSQAQLKAEAIEMLRNEFDIHLASLRAPGAGDQLRTAFANGVRLGGKVKAGAADATGRSDAVD